MGWVPAPTDKYLAKVASLLDEPYLEEEPHDILVCAMCLCGGWVARTLQRGWVRSGDIDFCGETCAKAYARWRVRAAREGE